ncbi:MAG: hypothetical protein U0T72_01330 [Chitinophagales bacterium]
MKQYTFQLLFFLLAAFFLGSCGESHSKKVDVSAIQVDAKIEPFYKDFFSLNAENFEAQEASLKLKYNGFYPFYVHDVMGDFQVANTQRLPKENMLAFLADTGVRSLYDTVAFRYSNTDVLQQNIANLYRHIRYYFPEFPLPKPVTIISEFSYGAFTFDTTVLAISLDMYLGQQYPVYTYLDIPRYVQRKLRSDFIVQNCADVLYNMYFGDDVYQPGTPLLDAMINKGKKLYFMEMMLPNLPDSLIIGYTKEQDQWCRSSEYAIWQYMNQRDLLYTQSFMEHKRYLSDGPTTTGMPPESPGNIGSWVGWQIVRKFMKESGGKVSLRDLCTKYDAKTIASKAKYKPKGQ